MSTDDRLRRVNLLHLKGDTAAMARKLAELNAEIAPELEQWHQEQEEVARAFFVKAGIALPDDGQDENTES